MSSDNDNNDDEGDDRGGGGGCDDDNDNDYNHKRIRIRLAEFTLKTTFKRRICIIGLYIYLGQFIYLRRMHRP